MSEDEEVLDNFLLRDPVSPAEYMVGAYRAEFLKKMTGRQVELLQKFLHPVMGQHPGSSTGLA